MPALKLNNMKLLIVDDHSDMRRVLGDIVMRGLDEQVEIIECESGEEAVELYFLNKPDCVLMDYQLKKMSGFEATQIILDQDAEAKIIIVSSYDSPSFRLKAKNLKTYGFVSKENLAEITPILLSLAH